MTQHIRDDASYSKVEEDSRRSIHLIDCMQLFTEEETLGKDDAWYTHTHTHRVCQRMIHLLLVFLCCHSVCAFLSGTFTVNHQVLPRVQGLCASLKEV